MEDSSSAKHGLRPQSPSLNDLLGKEIPVLDQGFVRVIDYMGDDNSVVQAARVSYGAGTKTLREDSALIHYLMRHRHTTPFEMCELKLHVRVPMDIWRQWIRHRTASVNEYSTRYSIAIDALHKTDESQWRQQSQNNKQGSDGYLPRIVGNSLSVQEEEFHTHAREVYEQRLQLGVAREQARKDLPLSTYTESYWKIDLHNLLHFLDLRLDRHAQAEIREYATIIGEQVVAVWCPITWAAFNEHRRYAVQLSRHEAHIVKLINTQSNPDVLRDAMVDAGFISSTGKTTRSYTEMLAKLAQLGIPLNPSDD